MLGQARIRSYRASGENAFGALNQQGRSARAETLRDYTPPTRIPRMNPASQEDSRCGRQEEHGMVSVEGAPRYSPNIAGDRERQAETTCPYLQVE